MKNDLKSLEAILASWTPRRPSRALKDRIFGPKPEKDPVEVGFRMTWLAPASVAFVATEACWLRELGGEAKNLAE